MVTNLRHYQALKEARESLQRVEEGIAASLSTEFISQDIRQALYHIGTITGEVTSDEILGNIFRRFCIGK
jgi:tRNA modification GTPase